MRGLTRGLQLIADWMKFLLLAASKGNPGAMMDAIGVAKVWLGETVNEAGAVKVSSWALLFGEDPWKGSRAAYYTATLKWDGKL